MADTTTHTTTSTSKEMKTTNLAAIAVAAAERPTFVGFRPVVAPVTTRSTTFSPMMTLASPRGGGSSTRVLRSVGEDNDVQVHLVIPRNFNDAQQVADQFKRKVPVILNLQTTDHELSKRLIDFASGLTYAMDGGMQRIADKVFLLTPRNVEVSAEEKARLIDKGFFNQS